MRTPKYRPYVRGSARLTQSELRQLIKYEEFFTEWASIGNYPHVQPWIDAFRQFTVMLEKRFQTPKRKNTVKPTRMKEAVYAG